MQNKISFRLLSVIFILTSFQSFSQNIEDELLNKYQRYKQRYLNEFIILSPDVEQYGVNIPAIDRRSNPNGFEQLSWSDGNSNFNNYIILLVTEIELLKRYNQNYQASLTELLYSMLAIERLDLYSEYNSRLFWNDKIMYNGDSINNFIKYPADINGFMLRDDVSFGFWQQNHKRLGFDFGKPDKDLRKTNRYLSVFQKGVEPMQAMSQDNVIRMLEALSVCHHFMIKSAMVYKPWMGIGDTKQVNFPAIFATRWYMTNPVRKRRVAEGSGNDMGILLNAYGLGETGKAITGKNIFHHENSTGGFLKYAFKTVVFKELKLPLGSIALPKNWDDVLPRTLAYLGNINNGEKDIFYYLRDKRSRYTCEAMFMIRYLLNEKELSKEYHSGTEMWKEDSTFMANLLLLAPPDGPFSDSSRNHYSIHWATSSRVIWPIDKPYHRSNEDFEFAGLDYLMLHNLYRLIYGGKNYKLKPLPGIKKSKMYNIYTPQGQRSNKLFFNHAPVIINKKDRIKQKK